MGGNGRNGGGREQGTIRRQKARVVRVVVTATGARIMGTVNNLDKE